MKIKIVGTEDKTKGRLYKIVIAAKEVETGHNNRFIAHKRYNGHIIRAVYEYDINLPVLVTVYYPTAKRYFKGGRNFADKILP